MLQFSIKDFFNFLSTLSVKKRKVLLQELGWIQNLQKTKEFAKLYVNTKGELKNLNAVADEVELLTLEA